MSIPDMKIISFNINGLRARLQSLWPNPAACARMGLAGQQRVRDHFHHDHFVHRMKMLTLALAAG